MRFKKFKLLHRFFLLLLLSVALMFASHYHLFARARVMSSMLTLPFQYMINLPAGTRAWVEANYPDDSLYRKYDQLKEENLELKVELQSYENLRAENERLKELLRAPRRRGDHALSAEIIEIGLEPFTQRIAINRGSEAGIRAGQPVINAAGVLGQVSEVGIRHSVVTLITHPNHSLPAQIRRSGLRTIVQGAGDYVNVPFLPGLADIRNGDILVTSGIGGRFPPGYKVARVREVINDANSPFLTVHADAFADTKSRDKVLLLHTPSAPDAE
ncbi:MAG: rod shape-determining protein MreC [Gammaproteobacteria bacterium]